MPCEVNSNADSEFDLRAGGFYTRLVFTLTDKEPPHLLNLHIITPKRSMLQFGLS